MGCGEVSDPDTMVNTVTGAGDDGPPVTCQAIKPSVPREYQRRETVKLPARSLREAVLNAEQDT
jgi:hypothetical protein